MKKSLKGLALLLSFLLVMTCVVGCGGTSTSKDDNQAEETKKEVEKKAESKTSDKKTEEKKELKSYKFKLGYNTNEESVRGKVATTFKEYVETETDGRIKIEIFPAETLGSEAEMMEAVKIGAQDMQLTGNGAMGNVLPEYNLYALAGLINDVDEAIAFTESDVVKKWDERCYDLGYKVLTTCDLGFVQITNNAKPIYKADDLKGIKMRSSGDPIMIETFKMLGSSVSTMPYGELYMGLQQGVVEGQFNPLDAIYETKFFEVQDYLALVNLNWYAFLLTVNPKVWEELDPSDQKILEKGAVIARDAATGYSKSKIDGYMEIMKDEFIEITEPDKESFREVLKPLYDKYRNEIDSFDEVEQFFKDYRANK